VDRTWSQLSRNIREIQKQNAANLSFEENYRFAYNMVLAKEGRMLYDGTTKLIVENLETLAKERLVPTFPTRSGADPMQQIQEEDIFLKAVKGVWDDHIANMTRISQILKYMVSKHICP
jgi:cullin 3